MESTELSWRSLVKRQWPLASSLAAISLAELAALQSVFGLVQVLGGLVVCTVAVLAPWRPLDATLLVPAGMICTAFCLRLTDTWFRPYFFVSGVSVSMVGASMATIAILVREVSRLRAVVGTVLIVAAVVGAEFIGWPVVAPVEYQTWQPDPWASVLGGSILLVLAVGTGLYFRARDSERASQLAASVAAAQNAERMALARELHDVVAHYVTAIVVHANAGQVNRDVDVLPLIAASGNEALTAMRRLVGKMRDGTSAAGPAASSSLQDDVRALADESGLPVRLSFDLRDAVPQELARSVLRLVQESLTNTRKHASAVSSVDVSLSSGDGMLHLRVADDGVASGAPVGGSGGYGIVGMRERVELLGGTFSAGRREPAGWTVRADLPVT